MKTVSTVKIVSAGAASLAMTYILAAPDGVSARDLSVKSTTVVEMHHSVGQSADPASGEQATDGAAPGNTAVHGAWQVVCEPNVSCRIAQSIVTKDDKSPVVVARFYRWKGAAAETPAAPAEAVNKTKKPKKPAAKPDDTAPSAVGVFTMPLGIFLAPGFALRVDGNAVRRFPFENCDGDGCHLGVKVDKKLMAELGAGKRATVQFYDAKQNPVVLNLPLDGFAKAFEALK